MGDKKTCSIGVKDSFIENRIYEILGQQAMLDSDIATLFDVEVRRHNEQMRRNKNRFPKDFCFKLNSLEFQTLKSQIAISNKGRGGKNEYSHILRSQFVTSNNVSS